MLQAMKIYGSARNSSRIYLHGFLARAGQAVQPGQLVLDAGSGRAPYRDLFAHARYETADFLAVESKKYAQQDYVCDLAEIPVDDARFDHVLLTQVLEHIPEPAKVLAELHRVLKPGGALWLTAPLFYV
jgi:ubiquinone/menaquinone biosynthesis C-methylase UbiE